METEKTQKKQKGTKRKEVLEKKKAIDEIIKAASTAKDHLACFPPFRVYDRNGLSVYLESGRGERLLPPVKHYIQNLLKVNMEGPYGLEWPVEEKIKRREMVAPEARYIFVHEKPGKRPITLRDGEKEAPIWNGDGDPIVGFVHYRFVVEEEMPVLYVFELQLEPSIQGRSLGKFLMQLIELIARKNQMGAVMLTVQKSNLSAMNFYRNKMRFSISSTSPSSVDPLMGAEKSYEILCKTFDEEAKAKLEESCVGDE
ncbi:hypothetical protein AMTRI_Chr04g244160 [Amborella trichopoda]|uniref:N-alpha-acetyltransferase 40 isoform X3 n=1 Tax=Amborella trichopoda TaxID=13333 RepID=UPI0005D3AD51|nr:N-alpha-acetyltransferase 40 isoform X3 [Amborella trichopoda]|eukprot:XP_011625342.1 N-alpha-acetyltransferase 40 isoform X3 [Amborella trichopoda]